ncbi:MAG TPA: hypothetical protein VEK57_26990 [Thermoanaerobaculia bacterium]|nr:hypothetical protein [Thermoanaerobaculia bacterium]
MDVETKKPVSWGAVIGGVFIALALGIFIVPLTMLGGGFLGQSIGTSDGVKTVVGTVLSLLFAGTAYYLAWWLTGRGNADLATGVLIGGALMTLLAGTCGMLIGSM